MILYSIQNYDGTTHAAAAAAAAAAATTDTI
jgi:hypothetical protein